MDVNRFMSLIKGTWGDYRENPGMAAVIRDRLTNISADLLDSVWEQLPERYGYKTPPPLKVINEIISDTKKSGGQKLLAKCICGGCLSKLEPDVAGCYKCGKKINDLPTACPKCGRQFVDASPADIERYQNSGGTDILFAIAKKCGDPKCQTPRVPFWVTLREM